MRSKRRADCIKFQEDFGSGWVRRVERDDSGEWPKFVYETETGFNNGDLCLEWIEDAVKPFIEERGCGENGGKSVSFWDPAKCHITQEIKAALEKLNVICIFIPVSLTYKSQLFDVCYAATFKPLFSEMDRMDGETIGESI